MPGKKKRRRITKLRYDEFSGVDRPAMAPAVTVLMKRDSGGDTDDRAALFFEASRELLTKFDGAVPVMTDSQDGHAHLVWLTGERGGCTSYQVSADGEMGHDHPWTVDMEGNLIIGDAEGHSHIVSPESVMAGMRELMLLSTDAPDAVIDVVFARYDGEEIDVAKLEEKELAKELAVGTILCKTTEGLVLDTPYLSDGSFPIRCKADLLNAIEQVGADGGQRQAARHIVKRARVLGLEGELPDEGVLAQVAKAGHPAGDDSSQNRSGGTNMPEKPNGAEGDLKKQLDDATAKIETLTKDLERANKVAGLSDPHRAHYNALETDEKKATFLAKSEEDRAREITEITKGDPVIYKALDGTEYRQSDGDKAIRLAKQVDDQAKQIAKSKADAEQSRLEKRADDELGNCPGDVGVRAALLKAVDAIEDDELRKGAQELLKAGNTALAKKFVPSGGSRVAPSINGGTSQAEAEAELTRKAKELVEKSAGTDNPLDFYAAYDQVAESDPVLAKRAIGEPVTADQEG